MTYLEYISKQQNILRREQLNPNAIFQFIYALDKRIDSLLTFSNYVNDEVPLEVLKKANEYMDMYIKKKMPLAYIINTCSFFGYSFIIDENVLCPRNETEQWLEVVIDILKKESSLKVLDLCCGSGVIGLSIKLELPYFNVTLSDIDECSIKNATKNAKKHNLDVKIIESDLFKNIKGKFNVIVFNPPYVDYDYPLDDSVLKYEPYNAIYSPHHGLLFYEKILEQIHNYLCNSYLIAMEIGFDLADKVVSLVKKYLNVEPFVVKDSNNKDRAIIINRL